MPLKKRSHARIYFPREQCWFLSSGCPADGDISFGAVKTAQQIHAETFCQDEVSHYHLRAVAANPGCQKPHSPGLSVGQQPRVWRVRQHWRRHCKTRLAHHLFFFHRLADYMRPEDASAISMILEGQQFYPDLFLFSNTVLSLYSLPSYLQFGRGYIVYR